MPYWAWPCRAGFACSDFWGVGTAGLCPLAPELGLELDWRFWGCNGTFGAGLELFFSLQGIRIKDFLLNFVIFMGFSLWFAGSSECSELHRASEQGLKVRNNESGAGNEGKVGLRGH